MTPLPFVGRSSIVRSSIHVKSGRPVSVSILYRQNDGGSSPTDPALLDICIFHMDLVAETLLRAVDVVASRLRIVLEKRLILEIGRAHV